MHKLRTILVAMCASLLLFSGITFAQSNQTMNPNQSIHQKQMRLAYYTGDFPDGRYHCRWVGGYWKNGHWRGARKVCRVIPAYERCHWVGGYWRHGYWHKAKRICYGHRYY